jgi:hypothetical protein
MGYAISRVAFQDGGVRFLPWVLTATGRFRKATFPESGRTKPIKARSVRPSFSPLDLGLLRDLQCVISLDPKVSNGALQLAVAEQELDGP